MLCGRLTGSSIRSWCQTTVRSAKYCAAWLTPLMPYGFGQSPLGGAAPNHGVVKGWNEQCNGGNTFTLYVMCDTCSVAELENNLKGSAWFSDQHNVEVTLIMAAGYYFESDMTKRASLKARAEGLLDYIDPQKGPTDCALSTSSNYAGPPRAWNWQMRSNSVRTWQWVTKPGN